MAKTCRHSVTFLWPRQFNAFPKWPRKYRMQIDSASKSVSLDIRDPDFYNDPYPWYKKLRDSCPMFFWEQHDLWTFCRHEDVTALFRDRRLGRKIDPTKIAGCPRSQPESPETKPFFDIDSLSMLAQEPPTHTRLRGLVQKAFMARQVEQLRPRIEKLCHELVDQVIDQGHTDLLTSFATPLPVTVIAEMLGVPIEMKGELLAWSHAMVKMYEMERTKEAETEAVNASREFVSFLRQLVNQRRTNPRDDLITRLVEVEEAGEKLTEDELIANCILLLNAGHEATVNLIGNGTLALLKNRDQLERWKTDRSLTDTAVEELLRYDTPLHQFNRWVLEPFEFHGQRFEVGQEIAMLLGSANRDGDVFELPEKLDLGRTRNPHVSLGGGIHYCLGAPLARLELGIAFNVLMQRLPNMELVDEPMFCNSFHFHGLESLNVRY
jgi:cytochrome P450